MKTSLLAQVNRLHEIGTSSFRHLPRGLLTAGLLVVATSARAETTASVKIAENTRLVPLKKITVGPDDQYSAAVDPQLGLLVYVHKSDLVAHLVAHDLKNANETDLLPLTADSQEPVFGPNGVLAFAYFKFDARGDICYFKPAARLTTIKDSELTCLKRSQSKAATQRSNPFWMSDREIGYLERDPLSTQSEIVVEDIHSGKTRILVKGSVWSPSVRAGGHLLAYNELMGATEAEGWRMVVRDLRTGQAASVHLALPGLSGFPILSEDDKYLYFSHFMSDSNDDRTIDGSDNAVIFRLNTDLILHAGVAEQLMPEQLTSSDSSCSFPRPMGDQVYATCAFEGSLDIYSLPLTGVVPASWSPTTLQNALQTSRTYAERVLILNTMKARQPHDATFDEQLFFNHLMEDDTVAARFYLNRVSSALAGTLNSAAAPLASTSPGLAKNESFFKLTRFLLQARELKKSQPVDGEIGREFRHQMMEIDANVQKVKGEERFAELVRGAIRADLQEWSEAESYLKKSRAASVVHPIERYFRLELARRIFERDLPVGLSALGEVYRDTMLAPELSEESKIYYTFNWLKTVASYQKDLKLRMATIAKMSQGIPAPVLTLLRAELISLKIATFPTVKEQDLAFRELNLIMSDTRNDYFLRKALYVRTILNLEAAANFKYLSIIAENWLKYTQKGDIEFSYAREIFADSSLDQAYGYLNQGKLLLADNFFYAAVMFTDDLEAHYGYTTTLIKEGKRAFVDRQYEFLQKQHFVEDNMKFLKALLALIDAGAPDSKDSGDVKALDQAIEQLEAMTQDRDSATRHLLLGYSYMDKMLRLASGAEFNQELFESAHRNLMLAYDLGRDNVRIRISALMDLGILHERAQNHGLAARFFALRKALPFEDDADRARFEWLYAKSLDRSQQPEAALKELAKVKPALVAAPMKEREAFDAALAGQYEKSCELYAELFKNSNNVQGDENLAKVNLMYGFALVRAGHRASAMLTLQTALAKLKTLKVIPKDHDHAVDFVPARLELIANGLLAQAALDPKLAAAALQARMRLLKDNAKLLDNAGDSMIQTQLQIAEAWRKTDPRQMKAALDSALALAEQAGEKTQYLSHAIFRTAVSYLAEAAVRPDLFGAQDAVRAKKIYEGSLKAYDHQLKKVDQPQLAYQKVKLQLLWSAFVMKVLHAPATGSADLASVMKSTEAGRVKSESAEQWSELEALARGLAL